MITYPALFGALFLTFVLAGYSAEKYVGLKRPPRYYLSCIFLGLLVYPTIPVIYLLLGEMPAAFIGIYALVTVTIAVCLGIAIRKFRHPDEAPSRNRPPVSTSGEVNELNLGLKP